MAPTTRSRVHDSGATIPGYGEINVTTWTDREVREEPAGQEARQAGSGHGEGSRHEEEDRRRARAPNAQGHQGAQDRGLAQDAGVPDRVATGLRPHAQPVWALPDGDPTQQPT